MSEITIDPVPGEQSSPPVEPRRPKHRRDDVPVDGGMDPSEFGENPDIEVSADDIAPA